MNKNKLLFFASLLMVISVITWSCKDEFSAEDQMRLQAELDAKARQEVEANSEEKDSIALSIQVYNASVSTHSSGGKTSSIQGASGITVRIAAEGTILNQTTSAEGIANFWVQPGTLSGTVSGTGFATANFTVSVTEAEDGESGEFGEQATNASVVLPIFSNTGSTTARVSGQVTYEGNLLNSTREVVPNGTAVTFRPDANSLFAYYGNIASPQADIDAYSFEGTFTATTTNGAYAINLPAGANGLTYTHSFNDFSADQSIAINNYLNEPASLVRDIVLVRTNFGQLVGASPDPPVVAPVQFDIQAPPPAGTGATVNLRLIPQSVLGFGNPVATVIAGGSGYTANSAAIPVTINGGSFDSTVPGATQATVFGMTNAFGQIIGLNVMTPGMGYRSQPTLTIGGGGSGAIVRLNWESPVASSLFLVGPSTVTAGGSGYLEDLPPSILMTGLNIEGEVTSITIGVDVVDGAVLGIEPDGSPISNITSAVVVSPIRDIASVDRYILSAFGELESVLVDGPGSGYADTPAPTITVRGLRGGSGAMVTATVNDHIVTGFNVVSRGSGYSRFANANFPTTAQIFSPNSASITVTAGQERVLDAYYGTGRRLRDVQ
jgi:hypothetical protein